jgi:hypothetical protein
MPSCYYTPPRLGTTEGSRSICQIMQHVPLSVACSWNLYKNKVSVESTSVRVALEESEAILVVRVIVREGQEKRYCEAHARFPAVIVVE